MEPLNKIIIIQDTGGKKEFPLPDYGELKIVCHDGRIKTIETTVKEKI